jgi:hypothetical protein
MFCALQRIKTGITTKQKPPVSEKEEEFSYCWNNRKEKSGNTPLAVVIHARRWIYGLGARTAIDRFHSPVSHFVRKKKENIQPLKRRKYKKYF